MGVIHSTVSGSASGLRLRGVSTTGCGSREAIERGKPHCIGFTGTGAGVEQSGLAVFDGRPHLFLKGERLPAAGAEPDFCEVGEISPCRLRALWRCSSSDHIVANKFNLGAV